ncbi:MAG: cache domain-containing protein [Candidatus Cloacimonadales bacterium]|nr:cache domain-containing protein [Candidatus Cloacimonadales bacterium]
MKYFLFVLVILGILISCTPAKKAVVPDLSIYGHEKTKEVVQLVYDAVDLIGRKGEKAFPDFRQKNSEWFYGENYVFVWGMDGMRYVYPPDAAGEGKNMLDLKDINGKPIGKMFVETAQNGEGWVFYEWTLPDTNLIEWKSTFIKKAVAPDGTEYLVGSGKYNMPIEKVFIETAVNEAEEVLQQEGKEAAFARFNDKADKFIFLNSYIFVVTLEGGCVVNPFSPQLVGTDVINLQDTNGKYFMKEQLEILKTQESCWIDYMWSKPGNEVSSQKMSYVKKVVIGDEMLAVGAGYYLE